MLPKGWSLSIVDDLFDVQLGKMLNQEAKAKHPQFPYLTNFNVRWGGFNSDSFNTMYFSEKERLKFSLLHGDIIMCEGGEVGRCAIWENQVSPCYFQKALHRLRSKGEIIPKYFQLYMVFISDKKLLEDYISRTSIAHLTREKLLTLPVNLPPLPEQIKIAEILSTWDNAINTVQKLLANSQQQKKALMQQLLTGKKRFLGFEEEWEEKPLKKTCQINKGVQINRDTLSDNDIYPVINGGITPSGYTSEYNVEANTITISEGGNSCGFVGFMAQDFWCGGHCYALKNVTISNSYLYHFLKFKEPIIMSLRVGSGLPNIQKKALEELRVVVPTDIEQQKIAAVLTTADQEIDNLRAQLNHLKQEKKALMQQLLTGKRRVKVEEAA